jgi:putative phage-type endonuclease
MLIQIIYNTAYDIYDHDTLELTVRQCYAELCTATTAEKAEPISPEPAEKAEPISPEPAEKAKPISPEPAEKAKPISPEPPEKAEPISPEKAEPISPEPTEKADNTSELALQMLRGRELLGDQRSIDWLEMRHKYITASISAACAGLKGASARQNYLLEKATEGKYKNFTGSCYTDKGNIFEPITNTIYCMRNNTHIHAFGLIPSDSSDYNFLAASTDGVTSSLLNIEIKTLASRVLDGKIKKEYWHQMQHQMFCLGLEKSHFLEAKYDEYQGPLALAENVNRDATIGAIIEKYSVEFGFTYEYSSVSTLSNIAEIISWEKLRKDSIRDETALYVRTIYWHLTDYEQQTVRRDSSWITTVGPVLRAFWLEVLDLKANKKKLNDMLHAKDIKASRKKDPFKDCQL